MFKEIFKFEITYRLKRPATWAYFGILFLFGIIVGISGNTPASEKVMVNSPIAIANMLAFISIFGIMLSSAIMGVPVYRDIEHKTENYYFSYPITEKGYLMGRFFGSMAVLLFVSLGFQLALIIGFSLGPIFEFEPAERFAPLNLWHYIQPTLILYWTNFFFAGCIFFAIVSLTKRVMLAYAGGALLFITYLVTLTLSQDLENKYLVSLLDPFALGTFENTIEYWTPVEQNTRLVPLEGVLIWNRVIWLGLGVFLLLLTLFRFDFQKFLNKNYGTKKKKKDPIELKEEVLSIPIPAVSKSFSKLLNIKLLWKLALLEVKNITRDNFFRAIFAAAVLFLFFDAWFGFPIYGTPSLPMTYYMLEVKDATYVILIFILIVFMTGEVLHRERGVSYDQIFGSLPIPNSIIYGSKFLALAIVSFFLVNMVLISGVFNQILKGYYNFELDMYATDLYLIEFPRYIIFVMLAFFVHSIVTKKFPGHVIAIAIWVLLFGLNALGDVTNNLYLYGYSPGYTISDMNGFGHFGKSLFWFRLYWLAFGAFLTLIGYLFWKRGTDTGRKSRLQIAKGRLVTSTAILILLCLAVFIGSGFYINYNTRTLNNYATVDQGTTARADYEKTLGKYDKIPQPKIIDVFVNAEVLPEERSATVSVTYKMVNKSQEVIDSLHLNWGSPGIFHKELKSLTIDGKTIKLGNRHDQFGYEIYAFNQPLKPLDTVTMEMTVWGGFKGFPNEGSGSSIVYNGTFFNDGFFPSFGYSAQSELTSDKDRKKYELPVKDYNLPPQDDEWGTSNLLFNDDADYITFEGIVSTAPDQLAIMPGYLQREWEENGRKYYHYKMEGELDFFYNVSSARYDVLREVWTGKDGSKVNIEIYHHPTHKYNLDRLVNGVQKSLDYFSEYYGPYQYRQMRIIEFPRYATFAQSFPNTVPFAESFGWVGDFSNPNDLDYIFMVTSHEVAHQWWGHQITPSATRGANQISETMAEYSSLMVMKKEYGVDAMQDFLRRELDIYLQGRANEPKFEKTLLDNDTQSYVWYRKGGAIMYGLQDLIGEERLNTAFKKYIDSAAFRPTAPFTTTNEWYSFMQEVTPDSLKYYLEDSFEKITLYSNKVENAFYKELKNGSYEVTLEIESIKSYYDGNGNLLEEPETPNYLDIAVFSEDSTNEQGMITKTPIIIEKKWITPGKSTLTYVVNEKTN
jgi:ABC-2 type transport system permease protein